MELRQKNISRCATKKEHLRPAVAVIDIGASKSEFMTFNPSEFCRRKSYTNHRHRNEKCAKLTLSENAIHDKMVPMNDQSEKCIYFVNSSGDKIPTNCSRGPKSRIRQFFKKHSIGVLVLIIFSFGFIDMVNGKLILNLLLSNLNDGIDDLNWCHLQCNIW